MRLRNLIKKLQGYPMDAFVSIKDDKLRVIEDIGCDCSPSYISLKDTVQDTVQDTVSEKFPLSKDSKEKRDAVLEAVNLLHNSCKSTDCLNCVLSSDSGDCILLLTSPDKWGLKVVEQNCKEGH